MPRSATVTLARVPHYLELPADVHARAAARGIDLERATDGLIAEVREKVPADLWDGLAGATTHSITHSRIRRNGRAVRGDLAA
jgi:hypothetical protein